MFGEFDFSTALINGIPLLLLVMGLVAMIKQLGISGNKLVIASLVVGLVMGVLYQLSLGVEATFTAWFGAVVYGIALGLTASGLVFQVNRWVEKVQPKEFDYKAYLGETAANTENTDAEG